MSIVSQEKRHGCVPSSVGGGRGQSVGVGCRSSSKRKKILWAASSLSSEVWKHT